MIEIPTENFLDEQGATGVEESVEAPQTMKGWEPLIYAQPVVSFYAAGLVQGHSLVYKLLIYTSLFYLLF